MHTITADQRSLILDGQRQLILSGAVHYPRSTPAMWPRILRESKRAGLNCAIIRVNTGTGYVFNTGTYLIRGQVMYLLNANA